MLRHAASVSTHEATQVTTSLNASAPKKKTETAHAGIRAMHATSDPAESGHLPGDEPALLLVAAVLWYLSRRKKKV